MALVIIYCCLVAITKVGLKLCNWKEIYEIDIVVIKYAEKFQLSGTFLAFILKRNSLENLIDILMKAFLNSNQLP